MFSSGKCQDGERGSEVDEGTPTRSRGRSRTPAGFLVLTTSKAWGRT